jgi:pimeloyl-ACP methyl ester carboxylesterase
MVDPSMPLYEYDRHPADQRPVLHLAHANGFPPEVYAELATRLAAHYRVVMLPARPLWPAPPPPESLDSWHILAEDLIAGIEAYRLAPLIGAGHSMGGVATLLAAVKRPELFRALVLIDPVVLPRRFLRFLRLLRRVYPQLQTPLARMALRRRRIWAHREEAFRRFRERPLFARWSDEVLWAYVDGITQPVGNGVAAIELRYSPEWEARIYEKVPLDIWQWVPRLALPAVVLRGEETNTFRVESMRLWRRMRPDLPVITVSKTGHLLPMEQPAIVARDMWTFLQNLSPR